MRRRYPAFRPANFSNFPKTPAAALEHLTRLTVGTKVRIIGRPEFGLGTITAVLGPNRYGVTCPQSRLACPVSVDGMRRSDHHADHYYPVLEVVADAEGWL